MSPAEPGSGPRLIDAMPRPLLVVFVLAALVAMVAALVVIVRPPTFGTVAVEARRPPPASGPTFEHTHDAGEIFAAPAPDEAAAFEAPCDEVAGVVPHGGADFAARISDALSIACAVAAGGRVPELGVAVRGLAGATIRLAGFERSGVESLADLRSRTIWVNVKFAEASRPASWLVPVLLHEAWHLARPRRPIDAREELAARRVEVAACRQFILLRDWPRWCEDARALTELPEETARDRLASAGYER